MRELPGVALLLALPEFRTVHPEYGAAIARARRFVIAQRAGAVGAGQRRTQAVRESAVPTSEPAYRMAMGDAWAGERVFKYCLFPPLGGAERDAGAAPFPLRRR
jgi:hypothetical protein